MKNAVWYKTRIESNDGIFLVKNVINVIFREKSENRGKSGNFHIFHFPKILIDSNHQSTPSVQIWWENIDFWQS